MRVGQILICIILFFFLSPTQGEIDLDGVDRWLRNPFACRKPPPVNFPLWKKMAAALTKN